VRFFPILYFILFFSAAFSQSNTIDSLNRVVAGTGPDTGKADALYELCREYLNESLDTSLLFAKHELFLSEKLNYRKGMAFAHKNFGTIYWARGENIDAINHYNKSLALFDSLQMDSMSGIILSNIGGVYFDQGDETKSLEYHLRVLKIGEERKDTFQIVVTCNQIGSVYYNKKATWDKALSFYFRALDYSSNYRFPKPQLEKEIIGTIVVNIGEIYRGKSDKNPEKNYLDSAQVFFNKAITIYKGTRHLPYALNDLGTVYMKRGEYDKAILAQKEAYAIAESYDTRNDMAIASLGLAESYKAKGDLKLGLQTYKQAEMLAQETGSTYSLKDIYDGLSQVYAQLHDFGNAFKYQGLLIAIKDKIYDLETDKKLGTLQFTFDLQKKESEINLLTKDKEIQEQVIQQQRIVRNSFMGAFATMVVFATVFFRQRNRISKEKKRSDELLLNILPEETAEELKATGTAKAKSFDSVSVLFTDFKNFTQASEKLTPEELVQEINYCYSEFDKIITRHGIEKIKTIGDAYMCAGGLPVSNSTHPFDVVTAGLEMVAFIEKNKQERIAKGQPFFELRLGIHTGPVVAGIVGIKKFAYDIWGDTVNTASRMESSGEIGRVNVSGTTYDMIKSKFRCTHRGKVKAKNKGEIDMYFVEGKIGN